MNKKLISILLIFVLCASLIPSTALAARDLSGPQIKAEALKSLGLFQGVSASDFALDRAPTRVEALVMFVRMIGEESTALSAGWSHSFTDVPSWADQYVGYAYVLGYTNGVSKTKFGSNDTASSAMFLTFVLRALAYSDGTNGDFTYNDPYTLARRIGLLTTDVDATNFLRADVALISWNALALPMNGGNKALADLLVMGGVFSQAKLDAANTYVKNGGSGSSGGFTVSGVKTGKYTCHTDSNKFAYDTAYCPSVTLNSDKTCTVVVNMGEGMATGKGTWSTEALDTGEIGIHIKITTKSWSDSYTYSFTCYNNVLYLSDGYMGITPVDSEFSA